MCELPNQVLNQLGPVHEIALALTVLHAALLFFSEAWHALTRPSRHWMARFVISIVLIAVWFPICAAPVVVYGYEFLEATQHTIENSACPTDLTPPDDRSASPRTWEA